MNEPNVKTITCAELHRASLNEPIDLIDVRTPQEFADVRAAGARSEWACRMMHAVGIENVVNVEGGTQAWYLSGLPIKHGAPGRG